MVAVGEVDVPQRGGPNNRLQDIAKVDAGLALLSTMLVCGIELKAMLQA